MVWDTDILGHPTMKRFRHGPATGLLPGMHLQNYPPIGVSVHYKLAIFIKREATHLRQHGKQCSFLLRYRGRARFAGGGQPAKLDAFARHPIVPRQAITPRLPTKLSIG